MIAKHATNIIGHRQKQKGQENRDKYTSREATTSVLIDFLKTFN
jgi:hypothetical protein